MRLRGGVHADVEQGPDDPAHQSDDAAQYHPFQQRHRILSDVGHPLLQPFHVPSLRFFTASLYPVCYIISCGACQSPPLPPYEIFVKLKIFQPISHFLFFPVDSHDGMHYNMGNWQTKA